MAIETHALWSNAVTASIHFCIVDHSNGTYTHLAHRHVRYAHDYASDSYSHTWNHIRRIGRWPFPCYAYAIDVYSCPILSRPHNHIPRICMDALSSGDTESAAWVQHSMGMSYHIPCIWFDSREHTCDCLRAPRCWNFGNIDSICNSLWRKWMQLEKKRGMIVSLVWMIDCPMDTQGSYSLLIACRR